MRAAPQWGNLATLAVIVFTFMTMLVLEWRRPLRKSVEPKPRRIARNLTTAALSLVIAVVLQMPVIPALTAWAATHRFGLLHRIALPPAVSAAIALLLLDYTLWIWHWLNHRVPLLWRFHLVHHIDRDLDSSTALRFHFGEHALSVGYRALQVVLIGASAFDVWLWHTILFASILFHHANVELPERVERWLVRFVVTPRMHGIHHSNRREETNSNWSSLLTVWDALHRTLLLAVPQSSIVIGVPAYPAEKDVTVGRIQILPFLPQRDDWVSRA
jgi:sterol desaturase/sphingolipid hydroxylase (fatty acid hydroxylase superfamily)